jgi:hypothetical protein
MNSYKKLDRYTRRVLAGLVVTVTMVAGSLTYAVSHIETFI